MVDDMTPALRDEPTPRLTPWLRRRATFFLTLMGFWRRMTIGVRTIIVDGNKILLIRHTYVPGWQFPGGGVDPGETVNHGAIREAREETGIHLKDPMRLFGIYRNTIPPGRDHIAVYVCENFDIGEGFTPNSEVAEMGWFDVNDLPGATTPATRARIDEVFNGAQPSWQWNE